MGAAVVIVGEGWAGWVADRVGVPVDTSGVEVCPDLPQPPRAREMMAVKMIKYLDLIG